MARNQWHKAFVERLGPMLTPLEIEADVGFELEGY